MAKQSSKTKALTVPGFDPGMFKPHPKNPRNLESQAKVELGDWMQEFGDIGGICLNVTTGNTVAGNQRCAEIDIKTARYEWFKVLKTPDRVGTLAYGVVYLEPKEEGQVSVPFSMRLVKWTKEKEERALLIANKAGGSWDWGVLKKGFGQKLLMKTGFRKQELELHGIGSKLGTKLTPGKKDGKSKARNLVEHYVAPPFSVLDSRQGYWQKRKRMWLAMLEDAGGGAGATATRSETMSGKGDSYVRTINNGAAILDPVLAECLLLWFGQPGWQVFDPFAGRVFGFMAAAKGMEFTGMEIREEQAKLSQATVEAADLPGTARWICEDGRNLLQHIEPGTMDMMVSDPPYLWLEKYSNLPGDLSNMDEDAFFEAYEDALAASYKALKENRFAVLVVGEVRRKSGGYANLVGMSIAIMEELGFVYYNELVVIKPAGTLPFRAHAFMEASRKVGKQHQNVLVFYKGNPKHIREHFASIDAKLLGGTNSSKS